MTKPVGLRNTLLCLLSSVAFFGVSVLSSGLLRGADALPDAVDFNRAIRPILADTCFKCHGPDKSKREAELRLDMKESAFSERDGHRIIVAGDPAKSELYRRITTQDEDEHMPPADSGLKLNDRQISLVRRWIEQGARWQEHWSFIAPTRPALPKVTAADWCRNPIDYFILSRLEREGLQHSTAADKVTLIRRVTLDLTGLPPTPAEVDAFLADKSPDAFERVVDRLLNSSAYGERMSIRWLDLARYADTSGYQNDGPRYMWRWRDWVINAYNGNMPFDQFTIEQIAGDLLPNPTLDQKLATAFNRNHRGNAEGGIIAEEYAVEYVVDRVDTTATAWLGLTLGCARCHDHKYDPFTQREFYQLFAYFNNLPEYGRAIKEGNSPPYIKAPTPRQQEQLQLLSEHLRKATTRFRKLSKRLKVAQTEWEKSHDTSQSIDWTISESLVAHYPLNGELKNVAGESKDEKFTGGDPSFTEGRVGQAAEFDGERFVEAGDVAKLGYFDKFSLAAWVNAKGDGTIVSRMVHEPIGKGYYVQLKDGHIQVNLVVRWLDDSIRVETKSRLPQGEWHHISMTYDGSRVAKGIRVYVDGQPQELKVNHDFLNQSFEIDDEPLRIGAGNGFFRGQIDDVRVYNRWLTPTEVSIVATSDTINQIAATSSQKRTNNQREKLRAYFLDEQAPKRIQKAYRKLVEIAREKKRFEENLPTLMVMQEMSQPRDTFVLTRGEYNKPGDQVTPGVPSTLSPLAPDSPKNRLGLADWLADKSNPLTARVAVNRYWQMYFGTGLVRTMEDFGSQGQRPIHPQLLDWLATEFVRSGWNVKALQKLIVTSATYRQSSRVGEQLLERDPENRLLARGPRFRLPAEMVRDQALAAAGLITRSLGGPSVKPYQPEGLWKEIATDQDYVVSKGADLYRRSLYTYWKRTVAPPTMVTFDAPSRESCIVNRSRTNTPLQALTIMNDVTFVEASRALAERVMISCDDNPETRITLAFRLVTGRRPRPLELKILTAGFDRHLDHYQGDVEAAKKLTSVGHSPRDESVDVSQLAAYTSVCSLIMNFDETMTKE